MTVQAPHCPRSQPFLVPVRCRRSRSRSSSVTRGSSSAIVRFTPFTVRLVVMLMQCSEDNDGFERPTAEGSRPCGLLAIRSRGSLALALDDRSVGEPRRDGAGMASPPFARRGYYVSACSPSDIRRMPPFFKPPIRGALGMRLSDKSTRKPRIDAVRNRERVLEAAKAVFSAGGADASLEAVARSAGVGIGTLYRHFPTREALFEAVYRREVQQLADLAEQLKQEPQPVDALRRWLRSNVKFVATKKGMSAALALATDKNSELFSYSFDRLTRAVAALLDRAIAAGEIRDDISPEDVLRALVGMCYMHNQPGWQASVLRLVDVFVDGLRIRPVRSRARTKRKKSS